MDSAHSVFEAQQLFDMPRMYAAIFAAGALGYGLNLLFLLIETPLRPLVREIMSSASDLSRLSAVELRELVRARKASPVEILDAHLAAIARFNPKFNAIVTLVEDQARAAAKKAADRTGPVCRCTACRS